MSVFTDEMIEEIRERLVQKGIKDTQIRLIKDSETLTGEESFVIVKDGENIRIPLQKIYDEIAILKSAEGRDIFNVSNYVVTNDITGEHNGILTLAAAISATPEALRKVGQIITFKTAEGKWKRYQMVGKTDNSWIESNFIDISVEQKQVTVPSNVSYFNNDSGYITESGLTTMLASTLSKYIKTEDIENLVKQFTPTQEDDLSTWSYIEGNLEINITEKTQNSQI